MKRVSHHFAFLMAAFILLSPVASLACSAGDRAILHDAIEDCWNQTLTDEGIDRGIEIFKGRGIANPKWEAVYVQMAMNCVEIVLRFEKWEQHMN